MNWAWTTSLDQLWRSPTFPMGLTLAAAAFFGIILLIALLRAEKSVANGALTVITLLAIGIAAVTTMRGLGPGDRGASGETRSAQQTSAVLPALSCIDDLAGETVLTACEKALFGSAESTAAAVSYAASQVTRLTAFGDAATANRSLSYELLTLRHAIERDRYGLIAQVLVARECTPSQCAAFRALTDTRQIVANMTGRAYDGLVSRYAASWNAPAAAAPVAALSPSVPTGKPTNADFPTAASTPAVSIMTPEPASAAAPSAPRAAASPPASPTAAAPTAASPASAANAALLSPRPTSSAAPAALAAAKKQSAPKPSRTSSAPVQLAPAVAPAASTD
jgi:hypothetical protein